MTREIVDVEGHLLDVPTETVTAEERIQKEETIVIKIEEVADILSHPLILMTAETQDKDIGSVKGDKTEI